MTETTPSILPARLTRRHRDRMGDLMRRASIAFSIPGLTLMVLGFFVSVLAAKTQQIPGDPMLPFDALFPLSADPAFIGLLAMSAGIVILAALPVVRIFLALWLYVKGADWINAATALGGLLELFASSQVGRQ
jgi:hypothetical protein